MTPKKYRMERISQDFDEILTQVTFKVKTFFHVFFSSNTKVKIRKGFGVKTDRLLKFLTYIDHELRFRGR